MIAAGLESNEEVDESESANSSSSVDDLFLTPASMPASVIFTKILSPGSASGDSLTNPSDGDFYGYA
jgi:hypothetical protein